MAWCSFNEEQEVKVVNHISGKLSDYIKDPSITVVDPIAFMQDFYKLRINRNDSPEKAYMLTAHIPSVLRILSGKMDRQNAKKILPVLDKIIQLENKVLDDKQYLTDIFEPGYESDIFDTTAQEEINEIKENPALLYRLGQYETLSRIISFRPAGLFTTTGQQTDPNEFKYQVLAKIGNIFNESPDLEIEQVSGGIKATLMLAKSFPEEHLTDFYKANPNAVIVAITNGQGDPIRFDQDYNITYGEGTPIFFSMRTSEKDKRQTINEFASTLMKEQNISKEEALKQASSYYENEEQQYNNILEYLGKNPDAKIVSPITGISRGTLYTEPVRTKHYFSEITENFVPTTPESDGKIFINLPNTNYSIEVFLDGLSENKVESIITLLTEEVYAPDRFGNLEKLTDYDVNELLNNFLYSKKSGIEFQFRGEDNKSNITINYKQYDYVNDKERTKEALRTILTKSYLDNRDMGPAIINYPIVTRDIANGLSPEEALRKFTVRNPTYKQFNVTKGEPDVIANLDIPNDQLTRVDSDGELLIKDRAIVSQIPLGLNNKFIEAGVVIINGQQYTAQRLSPDTIRIINYTGTGLFFHPVHEKFYGILKEKVNAVKSLIDNGGKVNDFSVENIDGRYVLVSNSRLYNDILRENSYTYATPNKDGRIISLNGYIKYQPSLETIDKIEDDLGKKKETIKIGLSQEEIDAAKNIQLEKNKYQKSVNKKVEDKAQQDAENWYTNKKVKILGEDGKVKTVTLSSLWPLTDMMNAVNQSNPNAVATWADYGVTLWQGSDFTDLYHEAWHGFTQNLLSGKQRSDLYTELRKANIKFTNSQAEESRTKTASDRELEELLAEDFRGFALSKGKKQIKPKVKKNIFQKLWDLLTALFNKNTSSDLMTTTDIPLVNELYEKLYKGDLSQYFVIENKQVGLFNHEVIPVEEEMNWELSYDDTNQGIEALDFLLAEYIKSQNQAADTKRYTGTLLKTQAGLNLAYKKAYETLGENIKLEQEDLAKLEGKELTETEKEQYKNISNRLRVLRMIYDNYSENPENYAASKKGFIEYHLKRSSFLSYEEKLGLEDDSEGKVKFERPGNDESIKSGASAETLYLLRGLVQFDSKGNVVMNDLGFPKLIPIDDSFYYLGILLENNLGGTDVYTRLVEAQKERDETGVISRQVLDLLGTPATNDVFEQRMWSSFITDFDKARISLRSTLVSFDKDGNVSYQTQVSTIQDRKVFTSLNDTFQNVLGNPNLVQDPNTRSNILNSTALMAKYFEEYVNDYKKTQYRITKAGVAAIKDNPYSFLKELGIYMSDTPNMLKFLNREASRYGDDNSIMKIAFALAANHIKYKGQIKSLHELFDNEDTSKKFIINAQIKYGNVSKSLMTSTAVDTIAYLHSDSSSLSKMIIGLNSVQNYNELLDHPYLSHLHASKNPLTKHNKLMEALFDFDNGGVKRKESELTLQIFSGIELRNHRYRNWLTGVEAYHAEELDRWFSDFENFMYNGISTATQHGDKKTTPIIQVARLNSDPLFKNADRKRSRDKVSNRTYVSPLRFRIKPESNQHWSKILNKIMVQKVHDELSRVQLMRSVPEKNRSTNEEFISYISGINDKSYGDVGSEFQIMRDILSAEVMEQLYAIPRSAIKDVELEEYLAQNNPALLLAVESDITDYFESMSQSFVTQFKNIIPRAKMEQFLTSVSKNKLDFSVYKDAKLDQVYDPKTTSTDAIMKAFWVNQFLHNYEVTTLLYGDPAQYNMVKDEFAKRNSGIMSNGLFPRSDQGFIDFINSQDIIGEYTKSFTLSLDRSKLEKEYTFNGIWNSAIMQDPTSTSVYLDEFHEHYINFLKKKQPGKTEEEYQKLAEKKFGEYADMKEADGQGWMTLPAYKILSLAIGGKWSAEQEALYKKIMNGTYVDTDTVLKFFPVKKMQYWGPLKTEGLSKWAMHKFSLMPLVPNVIRGRNLEILHNKMIEQNIHYATVQSGSKIINISNNPKHGDELYTDIATRTIAQSNPDYQFTVNKGFSEYFKEQVATNTEYKGKVTFSTQLKKLAQIGLYDGGVPSDYKPEVIDPMERYKLIDKFEALSPEEKNKYPNYVLSQKYLNVLERLVDKLKSDFRNKFGLNEDNTIKKGGNVNTLIKKIKDSLSSRDVAEIELEGISLDDLKQGLKYDLSLSINVEAIEKILMSIVEKQIIKPKMYGEALVMASTSLFERPGKYRAPTAEEQKLIGTDDMPFYRPIKDKNENVIKTSAMKVKVAITGDFRALLDLDDVRELSYQEGINKLEALNRLIKDEAWLDRTNHREMITMVGVRIPVQGANSMEFMEVFEFLPENMGNIIVVSSEIVAKSGGDFDIDKLTVLAPSIKKYGNKVKLVSSRVPKETVEELKAREKELRQIGGEIRQKADAGKELTEAEKTTADKVFNELNSIKYKLDSGSVKGIQNELISTFREIMERPENYLSLVIPNSTDVLKQGAIGGPESIPLEDFTREYDPKEVFRLENHGDNVKSGRLKKGTAHTNIFTPEYNSAKRIWNSKGGQGLAIGAVENTIHVAYTTIGLHLNPYKISLSGKNTYRQTIAMPHNSVSYTQEVPDVELVPTKYGGMKKTVVGTKLVKADAISMASLSSLNKLYDISDLISQAINGWVDVAKDSWIFDIQGNKVVAPTLTFLIQAGVDPFQAIYWASQPLIIEYVKAVTAATSMRSDLYDMPSNPEFWEVNNNARNYMYNKYKPLMSRYFTDFVFNEPGAYADWEFQKAGEEAVNAGAAEALKKENLLANIDAKKNDKWSVKDADIKALLHFMQVEDMANGLSKIRNRVQGFDTKRSLTFSDVAYKDYALEMLEDKTIIPEQFLTKLLNNTPVSQFHLKGKDNPIEMFSSLMEFKTNRTTLEYINKSLFAQDQEQADLQIRGTYFRDREEYKKNFIADMPFFLFQNLKNLTITRDNRFKGFNIVKDTKISVPVLFQDNNILINESLLKLQHSRGIYEKPMAYLNTHAGITYRYAALPTGIINSSDYYEYKAFVLHRELLRFNYSKDDNYKEEYEYKEILKSGISDTQAFELFLRDKALHNSWNFNWMFHSENSYADRFNKIKSEFPELDWSLHKETGFNVISDLNRVVKGIRESDPNPQRNLVLAESTTTVEQVDNYIRELNKLGNPGVKKVQDPAANKYISEFFKDFSIYAFMQSRQNTTGKYSISRLINDKKRVYEALTTSLKFYSKYNSKAILDIYSRQFRVTNLSTRAELKNAARDYSLNESGILGLLNGRAPEPAPIPVPEEKKLSEDQKNTNFTQDDIDNLPPSCGIK